jgi:hypothetical protein
LSLQGDGMVGVHCPLAENEVMGLLPPGLQAQVYEGQAYLSIFSGTLRQLSFFAGVEIPLEAPCLLVGIPALHGEWRGWYAVRAGVGTSLAGDYARRFLNLPLVQKDWSRPSLGPDGDIQLRLPNLANLALPAMVGGRIRHMGFKAQSDTLDAFLTTQPNLLHLPIPEVLQFGPTYLPPMRLKRIEIDLALAEKGYVAHFLDHWEMIAWRPQRIRMATAALHENP